MGRRGMEMQFRIFPLPDFFQRAQADPCRHNKSEAMLLLYLSGKTNNRMDYRLICIC